MLLGLSIVFAVYWKAAGRLRRLRVAMKVIDQHHLPASERLLAEGRASCDTSEERARWDQLLRAVLDRTGGALCVGHVVWMLQVLDGVRPPEPVPGLHDWALALKR